MPWKPEEENERASEKPSRGSLCLLSSNATKFPPEQWIIRVVFVLGLLHLRNLSSTFETLSVSFLVGDKRKHFHHFIQDLDTKTKPKPLKNSSLRSSSSTGSQCPSQGWSHHTRKFGLITLWSDSRCPRIHSSLGVAQRWVQSGRERLEWDPKNLGWE